MYYVQYDLLNLLRWTDQSDAINMCRTSKNKIRHVYNITTYI